MSIKNEVRSGVIYTFIFRYAGIAAQIFTTAILARLLSPSEFGVVVAVLVFVAFFQLLSDSGLAVAIIQKKDLTEQELYSLFIITIISGAVLSFLFFLAGPFIADFYDNIEYIKISKLLSISLFLYAAHIVPFAVLFRDERFKAIGVTNFAVQVLSALFAIFLAWEGYSYYALVYQSIFQAAIRFVIVLGLSPVTVFKRVQVGVVRKIFTYSMFKLFYDIVQYVSRNLDNLLIGKYLGVLPLGFYDKAYKLMLMPVGNLADVISPVLHPVLSKHQHDPDLIYQFYKKLTKFLVLIGMPLSVFLFFAAEEIIRILFGDQWLGSIASFRFLALAIWPQMVLSASTSLFLTLGRSDYLFMSGFISSSVIACAIFAGIFMQKSIEGIALFLMIAFFINLLQVYYIIVDRFLKKSIVDFFSSMLPGFYIGVPILFSNLLFSYMVHLDNVYLSFSIKAALFSALFLLMLFLLKELRGFIEIIKPSK